MLSVNAPLRPPPLHHLLCLLLSPCRLLTLLLTSTSPCIFTSYHALKTPPLTHCAPHHFFPLQTPALLSSHLIYRTSSPILPFSIVPFFSPQITLQHLSSPHLLHFLQEELEHRSISFATVAVQLGSSFSSFFFQYTHKVGCNWSLHLLIDVTQRWIAPCPIHFTSPLCSFLFQCLLSCSHFRLGLLNSFPAVANVQVIVFYCFISTHLCGVAYQCCF